MENKTLTPIVSFENAREAIDFYKNWLSAQELFVMPSPVSPDKIMHAHINILGKANYPLFMADCMHMDGTYATSDKPYAPLDRRGFTLNLDLDSANQVDELFKKGLELGCISIMEPAESDWALRFAMMVDKMGITWSFNVSKPMQF